MSAPETEPQHRTCEGLKGYEDYMLRNEATYWCNKLETATEIIELLERIERRRGRETAEKLRNLINEERERRKAQQRKFNRFGGYHAGS